MDLRKYYSKIREIESGIDAPFVVLVSLETPDGGKTGVCSEATRAVAARQIAEGRSRLATENEAGDFHARQAEERRESEALAAASRMQVVVVPGTERTASKLARGSKD